jgi:hypothetical protein
MYFTTEVVLFLLVILAYEASLFSQIFMGAKFIG